MAAETTVGTVAELWCRQSYERRQAMRTKLAARTHNGRLPVGDQAASLRTGAHDDANLGPRAATSERQQMALAAARELLASTVEAINPGTSARDLLACLTGYRARLADLVAASPVPGSQDGE